MTKRFYDLFNQKALSVTQSVASQNTFTEAAEFDPSRPFNLSVTGTWAGTVTLQRSYDDGTSWGDVDSYTANTEKMVETTEVGVLWRLGIKTGGYTSGTAVCRLSQ